MDLRLLLLLLNPLSNGSKFFPLKVAPSDRGDKNFLNPKKSINKLNLNRFTSFPALSVDPRV